MTTPFLDLAPYYWAASLPVIPLQHRDKKPVLRRWNIYCSRLPDASECQHWLSAYPAGNLGLPLGPRSGLCMIDIDSDDPEVIEAIRSVLPRSPWERVGKKGMVLAYRFSGLKNFKIKGPDGSMVVELLGEGNQVVLPGSIHPDTGRPYVANAQLWDVLDEVQPLPADIATQIRTVLGLGAGRRSSHRAPTARRDREPIALNSIPGRVGVYVGHRLADACHDIAGLGEGDRNNTLFKRAVAIAAMFAGCEGNWEEAVGPLTEAALACGLVDHEIAASLESARARGSAQPMARLAVARDWVFVSGADRYYHPTSGAMIKPSAFRTEFDHLSDEGPIVASLQADELLETVQDLTFDPTLPVGIAIKDGRRWWNTYVPPSIVAEAGNCAPFIRFMEHLIPDDASRRHLMKMTAYQIRHPGKKLKYALLMTSRQHGTGKSTFFEILFALLGPENCRKATSEEMEGSYQAFLQAKLYVLVEEVNLGRGLTTYNRLKEYITSRRGPVRLMYRDTFEADYWANFGFTSNLMAAFQIAAEDRRMFVVAATEDKLSPAFWSSFYSWWREHLPQIRHHFDELDLSDFNPDEEPPMTEAKLQLIADSRRPVVKELLALIANAQPPFHTDIVTRVEVIRALQDVLGQSVTPREVEMAMREIGGVDLKQHDLSSRSLPLSSKAALRLGVAKPSIWAIRNSKYWQAASRGMRMDEFVRDEGWLMGLPILPEGMSYSPPSNSRGAAAPSDYDPIRAVFGNALADEFAKARAVEGQ